MDSYTKFPNKIYDALLGYSVTNTQLKVILYIIRNTNGWGKPGGDKISVSKMAKDIKVSRPRVSGAVNDLAKMGLISIEDEDRRIRKMRVTNPTEWEQTVTQEERYHMPLAAHTKEKKIKSELELSSSAPQMEDADEWMDAKELLRRVTHNDGI